MKSLKLYRVGLSFRVLASAFLIAVGVGYLFGLVNIYNNTGFSYTGIVTHYRGEDSAPVPPDFAVVKLVQEHHVHLFGLSMIFFLAGFIFCLTSLPEWFKAFLLVIPFAGMLLDFTSFWLLVFVSPVFAFCSMVFGGLMALSFFLIVLRPLYEMWIIPIWRHKWGREIPWFLR